MKESYVEGLASYGGPESCVHIREGVGEALTGEKAGRVLSCEIHALRREVQVVRGAEVLETSRRPHRTCRFGEARTDPAQSETPGTLGNSMRENREAPLASGSKTPDRLEKAISEVLESGLRTGDIMADGCKQVSTVEMGAAILERFKALAA